MSLTYIIDGYNLINHPVFAQGLKDTDPRRGLCRLIRAKGLCGSLKNRVIIIFDGYPAAEEQGYNLTNIEVLFSGSQTADAKIKKIAEGAANPRVVVVVSDDKEIKFFARACRVRAVGVEEFMQIKKEKNLWQKNKELSKGDLSYSQIEGINRELKRFWLK